MQAIKCVAIGDHGAGTTELLNTFTMGAHPGEYIPSVSNVHCISKKGMMLVCYRFFENESVNIMIDGIHINLGLWDASSMCNWMQSVILIDSTFT